MLNLSKGNILGTLEAGGESVERILDIGRIAMSAEMLGNAEAAFETTIEYLETKKTIWCFNWNISSPST